MGKNVVPELMLHEYWTTSVYWAATITVTTPYFIIVIYTNIDNGSDKLQASCTIWNDCFAL